MSNKFSIVRNLDESRLTKEIVRYVNENKEDPYIFMNKETIDDLEYNAPLGSYGKFESCENKIKCGAIATYRGFNVYENNALKYGEVEIR